MDRYKYIKIIVKNKNLPYDFYWNVFDSKYDCWFKCSGEAYKKPNPYFMHPYMFKWIKKNNTKLPYIAYRDSRLINHNTQKIKLEDICIKLLKVPNMEICISLNYFHVIFTLVEKKHDSGEWDILIDNNSDDEKEYIKVSEIKGQERLDKEKKWHGLGESRYIKVSNLKSYADRIYNRYCKMLSYAIDM
jgi:hypothetical protein